MISSNLLQNLNYTLDKVNVETLLETSFSKEIRITMRAEQIMKEHKTPFPIVVELFEGNINFGVQGKVYHLKKGDILTLEGGILHDLKAVTDSIIRLTLSKGDKVERVKQVANHTNQSMQTSCNCGD